MLRTLYLLWLPIALLYLAIPVNSEDESVHHLHARHALASQIASLEKQYGDNIDTSLNGYDHELVANSMRRSAAKRSAVEFSLHEAAKQIKRDLGDDVDTSLQGYDLDDVDIDNEGAVVVTVTVKKRDSTATGALFNPKDILEGGNLYSARSDTPLQNYDAEEPDKSKFDSDVDFSLAGYDTSAFIFRRDDGNFIPRDDQDEAEDDQDWPADVDMSLLGYDHSVLSGRSLDHDHDYNEDIGASHPSLFAEKRYLSHWASEARKRDFPDEGFYDEDDEGEDFRNDRYRGAEINLAAQATRAAEAAKARAKRAMDTAEENVEGWYESVKGWWGGVRE